MMDVFQVLSEYKNEIGVEDSTYFNPMLEIIKYIKWLENQVVEDNKAMDILEQLAQIAETDIDSLIQLIKEHKVNEPELIDEEEKE